jgi:hypothetical protein
MSEPPVRRSTSQLDLAALAAASVPATLMKQPTSDEVHAGEIFDLLTQRGKLTKFEIMEAAQLTLSQFRSGWSHLRRSLGSLAVVENHGEASTYHLSNEGSVEAEQYRYWQDQHIYRRLWSLRTTLGQMMEIARRTDTDDGDSLRAADLGVADALASMKLELRRAGQRAEIPDKQVEAYLRSVSGR